MEVEAIMKRMEGEMERGSKAARSLKNNKMAGSGWWGCYWR